MKTAGMLGTRAESTQVGPSKELKEKHRQPIRSRGYMGVSFRNGSSNFIKGNGGG
jgi:hypothetical protein